MRSGSFVNWRCLSCSEVGAHKLEGKGRQFDQGRRIGVPLCFCLLFWFCVFCVCVYFFLFSSSGAQSRHCADCAHYAHWADLAFYKGGGGGMRVSMATELDWEEKQWVDCMGEGRPLLTVGNLFENLCIKMTLSKTPLFWVKRSLPDFGPPPYEMCKIVFSCNIRPVDNTLQKSGDIGRLE